MLQGALAAWTASLLGAVPGRGLVAPGEDGRRREQHPARHLRGGREREHHGGEGRAGESGAPSGLLWAWGSRRGPQGLSGPGSPRARPAPVPLSSLSASTLLAPAPVPAAPSPHASRLLSSVSIPSPAVTSAPAPLFQWDLLGDRREARCSGAVRRRLWWKKHAVNRKVSSGSLAPSLVSKEGQQSGCRREVQLEELVLSFPDLYV